MMKFIANWIASIFTSTSFKLGAKVFEHGKPWKVSSITQTRYGLFVAVYNSDSRANSKLFLNGEKIYEGREETIGRGLEMGDTVYFAGENGNLVTYRAGTIGKGVRLAFASCCVSFAGRPYVFNSDQSGIGVINCLNGVREFGMKGGGIVTQAVVDGDKLYAAASDGGGGVSCSDGTLISLPSCQCIVKFAGSMYCSSGNRIMEIADGKASEATHLAYEKIMGMHVEGDRLWVATSGPEDDVLGVFDRRLRYKEIGRLAGGGTVGGSVFMSHVTDGYFARCPGGNAAEVYRIVGY
jgi:hypothetical protein